MPDLLLVTARWPFGSDTEFLEREIQHLSEAFSVVRVAPMRPSGSCRTGLPRNVYVDETLARAIAPNSHLLGRRSRQVVFTRNLAARQPGRSAGIWPNRQDLFDASWWRSAALSRADNVAVWNWAKSVSKPDIAYTFWLSSATVGLRNAWPKVPLVSRAHGGDVYAYQHGWSTIPQQHLQLAAANLVACVSEDGRRYLAERFPERSQSLVTRHLGVADLGGLARPGNGVALKVLSASSIDVNKRVDLIARSLVSLAHKGKEVNWTHLGTGPQREQVDAILRQAPEGFCAAFPGHVELSEVHRQMQNGRFNVFMNLSRSEGLPVSIIEAQCVGLPVVATNVGGTAEAADPTLNEVISSSPAVVEVEAAVMRAAASGPELAVKRRERWAREFNSEVNYAAFARELADLAT